MAELRVELSLKGVGFPIIKIVSCQSVSQPPSLGYPERIDRFLASWLQKHNNSLVRLFVSSSKLNSEPSSCQLPAACCKLVRDSTD